MIDFTVVGGQFLAVTGFAALSACGGSAPTFTPIEGMAFSDVADQAEALGDKYGEALANEDYNAASDLPSSGTANYSGVIGLGPTQVASGEMEPFTVGQLSVLVDFGDNTMTGEASDWHDTDSEPDDDGFAGSATIDAEIDGATGQFSGELEGQFGDDEDANPFDAAISGGFAGEDAAGFVGSGTGTINVDLGEGRDDYGFGVIFVAEQ